jgi:hypothetical protein
LAIIKLMIAAAPEPAAFEVRVRDYARQRTGPAPRVSIWATEDGYALIASDGTVLFRGLGRGGRRQCLEYAREHGVLVVYG